MSRPNPVSWLILLLAALLMAGCQAGTTAAPRDRSAAVDANPQQVSLNRKTLPAVTGQPYRYLLVGHLYGGIQGDDREPDKALLEQLPALNGLGLRMMVSLGDMVKHSEATDFEAIDRQLLQPAAFPIFNTVGNHDVENRALYEQRYGTTYYSFQDGPTRLVFLDTEREECTFDVPQREMLSAALQAGLDSADVKQIFIFMHKTLFFKNERLFELKAEKGGPNVWDCYASPGFAAILKDLIEPAAARKPVYLFAGDVGATGNLTPYYEQRADLPITMILTGLGDTTSDAGILVSVEGGRVKMEVMSLTGKTPPPLETFTPDYWIGRVEKKATP